MAMDCQECKYYRMATMLAAGWADTSGSNISGNRLGGMQTFHEIYSANIGLSGMQTFHESYSANIGLSGMPTFHEGYSANIGLSGMPTFHEGYSANIGLPEMPTYKRLWQIYECSFS